MRQSHPDGFSFVQAFRNGEESGFDFFFRTYYKALVFFARQYVKEMAVAEDLVEDAFINVWGKREKMETETGLKNYLYKSVFHGCLRWIERRQSTVHSLTALKSLCETEEKDCSEGMIRAEMLRLLREGIEGLPEQCRKVFVKLFIEGKSVKEAAEELKVTISTVNNQKARGVKLLRERLRDGMLMVVWGMVNGQW